MNRKKQADSSFMRTSHRYFKLTLISRYVCVTYASTYIPRYRLTCSKQK